MFILCISISQKKLILNAKPWRPVYFDVLNRIFKIKDKRMSLRDERNLLKIHRYPIPQFEIWRISCRDMQMYQLKIIVPKTCYINKSEGFNLVWAWLTSRVNTYHKTWKNYDLKISQSAAGRLKNLQLLLASTQFLLSKYLTI